MKADEGGLVAHSAIRNSQFEIVMALFWYSFWDGRFGQGAFEFLATDETRIEHRYFDANFTN